MDKLLSDARVLAYREDDIRAGVLAIFDNVVTSRQFTIDARNLGVYVKPAWQASEGHAQLFAVRIPR